MSLFLPPEILDLIIDHLYDDPTALKTCCIASKSWVPRARTQLFAEVEFCSKSTPIESWTTAFPDPSNSPAHHARSLSVGACSFYTTASMDVRPWICSFRHVTKLRVYTIWYDDSQVYLTQLQGFSPVLESLSLIYSAIPTSEIFDLVCSFPSLNDLSLVSLTDEETKGGWAIPSTSPKFTGQLVLRMGSGIRSDVRRLLDLPGGLHFSSISITSPVRDVGSIADLILRCSGTLESLWIIYYDPGMFPWLKRLICALSLPVDSEPYEVPPPLDLSKATRLEDVEFLLNTQTIQWITDTLRSAKSGHLQQIAITVSPSFTSLVRATAVQEWEGLDHLLVQLWTSRSICPMLKYAETQKRDDLKTLVRVLLPEATNRGIIDVVESQRR